MSRRLLQLGLAFGGAMGLAYGLWAGEGAMVWQKAATLCLECIGLG